jgi:hypothetical protein
MFTMWEQTTHRGGKVQTEPQERTSDCEKKLTMKGEGGVKNEKIKTDATPLPNHDVALFHQTYILLVVVVGLLVY